MGFGVGLLLGLAVGFLGGVLGIGGGIILVPALIILMALNQHEAQGISLLVVTVTAFAGTIAHARADNVDWRAAGVIAPVSAAAGVGGALLAAHLTGETLGKVFATVILLMALWTLRRR
ncbi:MAG: sulfite exporter TauE/SafE family protein [Chloroflexi bacterium]|nr:sulfite exporter TauE/SafE family protein [Chloroflexota bacterium]